MTLDQETGEILDAAPKVSDRAIAAGREERREKREAAMGVGYVSLYAKLAVAYENIAPVLAKATVGQRGNYTSLDAVLRAVRPQLLKAGVLIRQGADRVFPMGDGQSKTFWTIIYTDLIDATTGEVQRTELPMPIAQANPQAVGGVLTYGRRYTLLAALGIASGDPTEDDDADSAMPRDLRDESEEDELIREFQATTTEADANKLRLTYTKRLEMLDGEAYARVKAVFQSHVKKLRSKPAEPPAKKGGAKNRIAPSVSETGAA